jgi:hypothetical protein
MAEAAGQRQASKPARASGWRNALDERDSYTERVLELIEK